MRLALVPFALAALAFAACDSAVTSCPDTGIVTVADSVVGTGQPASGGFEADYIGRLASNGTVFDQGRLNNVNVIRGFQQGVTGRAATDDAPAITPMRPGGIRRIFIPANFAYGPNPVGPIPACSDLIFDVSLIQP